MDIRIAVGLESTLDILITFPDLKKLEKFKDGFEGDLSPFLEKGYQKIASGSGGEVPIDGKGKEARKLLELAQNYGAEIKYALGGNAAQEAATLERLKCDTIFLGNIFSKCQEKLTDIGNQKLIATKLDMAQTLENYAPSSYIIQVKGENRYILTEGEGRRIKQLRSYLKNLPKTIKETRKKFGAIDALSLVGWQVIFGNKLTEDDLLLTIKTIDEIQKEKDTLIFTDAGGVGGLDDKQRRRLCEIYSQFDILSVNEDEVFQVAKSIGTNSETIIGAMNSILENSSNLSTVWLHTTDFQVTLTSSLAPDLVKEAQKKAALAGLCKVEEGKYPTSEKISNLKGKRRLSREGKKKLIEIEEEHQKKNKEYELVATQCYKAEKFFSTVGAGDVSSATYLHTLVSN